MDSSPVCPHCRQAISLRDLKCPNCRRRVRYKTAKEAYFSWGGMGLFDLIPGIRDLPAPFRLLLVIIFVVGLLVVLLPFLLLLLAR